MCHGRTAVAVRALDEHGGHARTVRKARAWLRTEIAGALQGRAVEGWPDDPARVAGTLALSRMAGVDFDLELRALARDERVAAVPWHAAQVVAALGRSAPEPLWRACVDHLAVRPWAPWTVLAARARGDLAGAAPAVRALVDSIESAAPHEGGCSQTSVPETALTAIVVEALDGLDDPEGRRAAARGRAFLRRQQLSADTAPAILDPALADGAFAASPLSVDVLRCDITAHAVLALYGKKNPPAP
jgi:hypothetical protein